MRTFAATQHLNALNNMADRVSSQTPEIPVRQISVYMFFWHGKDQTGIIGVAAHYIQTNVRYFL
jgi:hypothetical protein